MYFWPMVVLPNHPSHFDDITQGDSDLLSELRLVTLFKTSFGCGHFVGFQSGIGRGFGRRSRGRGGWLGEGWRVSGCLQMLRCCSLIFAVYNDCWYFFGRNFSSNLRSKLAFLRGQGSSIDGVESYYFTVYFSHSMNWKMSNLTYPDYHLDFSH